MSTEELLKVRYKVIADFPLKPFPNLYNVGDVLTDPGGTESVFDQNGKPVFSIDFDKYPHLFKKLEWWEERDVKDYPEYVKLFFDNRNQYVHKVEEWLDETNIHGDPLYEYLNRVGTRMSACVRELLPATEQEYQDYKSKQK